ncbi:cytidylyltransferase domain-containing protein [Cohnella luojiensis]|uniref:Acylneuraminate cytidylyltransferase family protein n=1 Tax=Cohnella luojiensis TaxID=652876 RepID=A0A4Y8M1P4_9BACL|nr:acylneuraminate cytidylyltransferase family protein [Cohnella luojiensis]TFE29043.1 acylneuraminate cytidylyltransferase family protein [Cohnella luojiensis]
MINGQKVLAVIPARGGSKGVPRKNIRELAGKPLIAWTIACASSSRYIDRCIISTDDSEIAEVSRRFGGDVPFIRPAELALDDTPGIDPVLHAIRSVSGYGIIVFLQPTSPLRVAADIDGCLERMVDSSASSCVSVTTVDKSPFWMYHVNELGTMRPLLDIEDRNVSRQKLPPIYVLNGAIYVATREHLEEHRGFLQPETKAYMMPRERSLDIDTLFDFAMAEMQIQLISD